MSKKRFMVALVAVVMAFGVGSKQANAEVMILVGSASNPGDSPLEVMVPLGHLDLPAGTTIVDVDISAVTALADVTLSSVSASPVAGETKLVHVLLDGSSIGTLGDPIASPAFFDFAALSGMVASAPGVYSDLDIVLKTILGPHDFISIFGVAKVEAIPEPASLALLGLGVVTMLRKRNRVAA